MQSFLTDCCQSLENEDENNHGAEIKIIKVCVCVCAMCVCVCVHVHVCEMWAQPEKCVWDEDLGMDR